MKYSVILSILLIVLLVYSAEKCQAVVIGKLKRRWFVGGNFQNVTQSDNSTLTVNNIASWNGKRWRGYSGGTDGPVNVVLVDSCLSVWIAGKFSTAGGVNTGPIAVWKRGAVNWARVGVLNSTTYDNVTLSDEIRALSVDCYNTPTDTDDCTCDAYIGGSFEFALNADGNKIAHNIARYNAKHKKWENLGGIEHHNISTPVNIIQKRNWGLTIAQHMYLWTGGLGFFKRYSLKQKTWKTYDQVQEDHVVTDILYDPYAYDDFNLIIAGQFNISLDNEKNETCWNICLHDSQKEEWLMFSSQINSSHTTSVAFAGNSVFVTGDLVIQHNETELAGSIFKYEKYVSKRKYVRRWAPASDNITDYDSILNREIYGLDICGKADIGCYDESFAIIGKGDDPDDGFIKFYDADEKEWKDFGQGFGGTGEAYSITSIPFVSKSCRLINSILSVVSPLIAILCIFSL